MAYDPGAAGPRAGGRALSRVRDALGRAGVELTGEELADALWLALAPSPVPVEAEPPVRRTPRSSPAPARVVLGTGADPFGFRGGWQSPAHRPELSALGPDSPRPLPVDPRPPARPVYALDAPIPGTGAAAVRVPRVPGLPDVLSVVRALRPLKRRVPSLHRYELDEAASAEAIAESGGHAVVLRPERARWLDLVLAVDHGVALQVWQDTLAELTRVLGTSGIFRTVRRVDFTPSAGDPAVDGDRTVVLVVTDGVGPDWRTGAARRTLARWARKAPTAILQPLPLRLWPHTALPARRMRVRSGRPAPANHLLHAYDPWLPGKLTTPAALPVPVLELGEWSLAPWADLIGAHGGSATLRVVDAEAPPAPPLPLPESRSPEDQLLAFQETVSPEAYELAAHLAAVEPLTLPVMRVVQAAALPGSSPSYLAEVLLSGLMEASLNSFHFEPGTRELLRTAIPASDARRTVDAVSAFLTPRLGRTPDFPALTPSPRGSLALPKDGTPFAELPGGEERGGSEPRRESSPHPHHRYVVGVRFGAGELRAGYLITSRLVLTAQVDEPAEVVWPGGSASAFAYPASVEWRSGRLQVLRITDPGWMGPSVPLPPVGALPEDAGTFGVWIATLERDAAEGTYRAWTEPAHLESSGPGEWRNYGLRTGPKWAGPSWMVARHVGRTGEPAVALGAAVFVGDELAGFVTTYDAGLYRVYQVSPVRAFVQGVLAEETGAHHPPVLPPEPDPGPRPEPRPRGAARPARVPGSYGSTLRELLVLLPWLADPVPFELLEARYPPGHLAGVLSELAEAPEPFTVDWSGRRLHYAYRFAPGRTPESAAGRGPAVGLLLAAYGIGLAQTRRRDIAKAEIARQVVALAAAVPPEEDDDDLARLMSRAGSDLLLRGGDGRTAVRLSERVLGYLDRRGEGGPTLALSLATRPALVAAAIASGLDAFVALSPETVAAFQDAFPDDVRTREATEVHEGLARTYEAMRAGSRTALPAYQRGLRWVGLTLGPSPLAHELARAVDRLNSPDVAD